MHSAVTIKNRQKNIDIENHKKCVDLYVVLDVLVYPIHGSLSFTYICTCNLSLYFLFHVIICFVSL